MTFSLNFEKRKPAKIKCKKEYFERCNKCKVDKLKAKNEYLDYLSFMLVFYIIIVSIVSTIKNKILLNDIFSFSTGVFQGIVNAIKELLNFAEWIANFAYKISNAIIANILYWIIITALILIFLILIGLIIYFIGKFGVKILKEKWDKFYTILCIVTTTIMIYFTDMINIKSHFDINIVFLGILTIVILTVVRVIYEKKKSSY